MPDSQEKYAHSPEEVKKADGMMTEEEKKNSENRELDHENIYEAHRRLFIQKERREGASEMKGYRVALATETNGVPWHAYFVIAKSLLEAEETAKNYIRDHASEGDKSQEFFPVGAADGMDYDSFCDKFKETFTKSEILQKPVFDEAVEKMEQAFKTQKSVVVYEDFIGGGP